MAKKPFVLIDLDSQADAVAVAVRGLSEDEILTWLTERGRVTSARHPNDPRLYVFVGATGQRTGFRITEQGKLAIIRYHSIYIP